MLALILLLASAACKNIQKGVFQFQSIGCCDPVSSQIVFEHPMVEAPQIILTIRALEYEGGPIAYFTSLNDVSETGNSLPLIPRIHCAGDSP
jgi:hypothetical protein